MQIGMRPSASPRLLRKTSQPTAQPLRFGRYSLDPNGAEFQNRVGQAELKTGIPNIYGQMKAFEDKMMQHLADFIQDLPRLRQQVMTRPSTGQVLPNPSRGYEKEVVQTGLNPQGQPFRIVGFYDKPVPGLLPKGFDVITEHVEQGTLTQRFHQSGGGTMARLIWDAAPTAQSPLQPLSVDLALFEGPVGKGGRHTQAFFNRLGSPSLSGTPGGGHSYRKDLEFKLTTPQSGDDFPHFLSINGYTEPGYQNDYEYVTAHIGTDGDGDLIP